MNGFRALLAAMICAAPAQAAFADDVADAARRVAARHISAPALEDVPNTSRAALVDWLEARDSYASWRPDAPDSRPAGPALGFGVLLFEAGAQTLVKPVENGPAWEAGHRGVFLINEPIDAVEARLRAAARAQTPTQINPAPGAPRIVTTPAVFDIPDFELISESEPAIIRVYNFDKGRTSARLREVLASIAPARRQRPWLFAIDLRYASGGDWLEALKSADLFLPEDAPLGALQTRRAPLSRTASDGPKITRDTARMALITSPHTASAAEAFALALRGSGARVIGAATFGKCAVQQQARLDGGTLAFTVARFYGPGEDASGCDGVGWRPDDTFQPPGLYDDAGLTRFLRENLRIAGWDAAPAASTDPPSLSPPRPSGQAEACGPIAGATPNEVNAALTARFGARLAARPGAFGWRWRRADALACLGPYPDLAAAQAVKLELEAVFEAPMIVRALAP